MSPESKKQLQDAWREIVDSVSLLILLDAAVMTHDEVPAPEHISVLLNQLQQQLLETSNRLDIVMSDARDGAS